MKPLLAISGSLRRGSFNTALANAARELVAPSIELEVATLHGIPLYDGDLEDEHGSPEAVEMLKTSISNAAGVLLVTPEYNNSLPGVFKNAIDWLSRPPADQAGVFGDRPFAIIGATPGGFGTVLAQTAWLPVLRTLGVRYWSGGRLTVARAGTVFDDSGNLTDAAIREQLREFVTGFHTFCQR